jgi:outer membrane lipoprotein carrier protein
MKLLWGLLFSTSLSLATITLPENFKAKFIQTVTTPKKKIIKYNGKVLFSHKVFFKWVYMKPTQKEVCTNGKEILVVDHDLEQVSAFYIQKGLNIAKVLGKAMPYKDDIYIAQFDGKKYTIQLSKSKKLQSIAYYDDLDNKVQILFTQMQYGKDILPKKSMQCNYPASYDVIRG